MRVLVVEDNPLNMELLLEVLELKGLRADRATDGTEALRQVKEHGYELILMDVELPDIHGVALLKQVRQLRPESRVVAFTSHAMGGDRERFLAEGFDDYIPKPIDLDTFMDSLENYRQNWGTRAPLT